MRVVLLGVFCWMWRVHIRLYHFQTSLEHLYFGEIVVIYKVGILNWSKWGALILMASITLNVNWRLTQTVQRISHFSSGRWQRPLGNTFIYSTWLLSAMRFGEQVCMQYSIRRRTSARYNATKGGSETFVKTLSLRRTALIFLSM